MKFVAEDLLSALLEAAPRPTAQAPRDTRGLYGLVDHHGDLRYIGSTSSASETLYKRIHQRHRTGSENTSHYFSAMYNTGRMWRDRKDVLTKSDGDIAKALRNEFVVDHCRAVWLPLPDTVDIAGLEAEVLSLAPDHAIAWNWRRMLPYEEPAELVEATLRRLGWGMREMAAIDRQCQRYLAAMAGPGMAPASGSAPLRQTRVAPFPRGPFRFFALDVETANNDRGSICQIGVACVRLDNSIETWRTYVDPQVDRWMFTYLHGISARTVHGAPTFAEVLPILCDALKGVTVYQHSSFDRSAVAAACAKCGSPAPQWDWHDSVHVARAAWPELRGNGGHGLASLKHHLGLAFEHHDAGEDARAAAEVVLLAEGVQSICMQSSVQANKIPAADNELLDLIDESDDITIAVPAESAALLLEVQASHQSPSHLIGMTEITEGNLKNNHIYLRGFFEKFPVDAIGGANRASSAQREISVDWGSGAVVTTDLDGKKRFFRKRAWIREFFEHHKVEAGDMVTVEEVAPYSYRVALQRDLK